MVNVEIIQPGRTISFRSEIAQKIGSIEAAILFENLHFWSDKGKREDGFIYKTRPELENETALSDKQLRTATKKLVTAGWIEVKKLIIGNSMTLHYKCVAKFTTLISTTDGNGVSPSATGETPVLETAKRRLYNRNSIRPVYNNKENESFKKTEYSQEVIKAAREAVKSFH